MARYTASDSSKVNSQCCSVTPFMLILPIDKKVMQLKQKSIAVVELANAYRAMQRQVCLPCDQGVIYQNPENSIFACNGKVVYIYLPQILLVVKNGVIVEKGKHEILIHIKDGFYASLVQLHPSG
ncbi:hypothetical protein Lal_00004116 [Lupinus albus]|nr:hypothetical protein Lal_00004116 [Lupinus albus]